MLPAPCLALLLTPLVVNAEVDFTLCPDGWTAFQDSCYLFGHTNLSFVEAEHYCRQHNGHLIHVDTPLENAFIKDHLRYMKGDTWWIGLSDEDIESIWKWVDNGDYATFTDWSSNQPDNNDHHHEEDCATITGDEKRWNDRPCTDIHYPVCERT